MNSSFDPLLLQEQLNAYGRVHVQINPPKPVLAWLEDNCEILQQNDTLAIWCVKGQAAEQFKAIADLDFQRTWNNYCHIIKSRQP